MCETHPMEVLQTLGSSVQLLSQFSDGNGGKSEGTHQFQPICVVVFNVLHDVSMRHPL